MDHLFLFHAPNNSRFCSGVFLTVDIAEEWIKKHKLSGVLTKYPVDIGIYDWALKNGNFVVTQEKQKQPDFIGGFSSATLEHYHYEDGICLD
jgi:hypothetical protein